VNRIGTKDQATPGVEGYVFDGADGGQTAFWTCSQTDSLPPTFTNLTNTCSLCRAATRLSLAESGFQSALEWNTTFPVVRHTPGKWSPGPGPSTLLAGTGQIGNHEPVFNDEWPTHARVTGRCADAGSVPFRPATTSEPGCGPEQSINSEPNPNCGDAWITGKLRDDSWRPPRLSEKSEGDAH
jgi:hypothetical protein